MGKSHMPFFFPFVDPKEDPRMQDGGFGTHPSRRQVVAVPTSHPGRASGGRIRCLEPGRWTPTLARARGTDIRNPEDRLSFLASQAKHKNGPYRFAHVCRVVVLKIAETHPLRHGVGQRSSRGNAARPPPPPPAEVDVEVVILIKQRVRSLESPVSITNWKPPTPQDGYDYHHLSTGVCQREQCGPDRGAGRGVPLPRPHLCLAAGLCQGGYGEGVWR